MKLDLTIKKINIKPPKKIIQEHGLDTKNGRVIKLITNELSAYGDRYTPFNTGNLKNNKVVQTNAIRYKAPYSRYQWYGKVVKNGTATQKNLHHRHGRKSKWLEVAWRKNGNEICKNAERSLKSGR